MRVDWVKSNKWSERVKRDVMTKRNECRISQGSKGLHVKPPRAQRGRPYSVRGRVPPTIIGRTESSFPVRYLEPGKTSDMARNSMSALLGVLFG